MGSEMCIRDSYCMVTGEMVGRARLNLAVEGEVIARLECDFDEQEIEAITEIED